MRCGGAAFGESSRALPIGVAPNRPCLVWERRGWDGMGWDPSGPLTKCSGRLDGALHLSIHALPAVKHRLVFQLRLILCCTPLPALFLCHGDVPSSGTAPRSSTSGYLLPPADTGVAPNRFMSEKPEQQQKLEMFFHVAAVFSLWNLYLKRSQQSPSPCVLSLIPDQCLTVLVIGEGSLPKPQTELVFLPLSINCLRMSNKMFFLEKLMSGYWSSVDGSSCESSMPVTDLHFIFQAGEEMPKFSLVSFSMRFWS